MPSGVLNSRVITGTTVDSTLDISSTYGPIFVWFDTQAANIGNAAWGFTLSDADTGDIIASFNNQGLISAVWLALVIIEGYPVTLYQAGGTLRSAGGWNFTGGMKQRPKRIRIQWNLGGVSSRCEIITWPC